MILFSSFKLIKKLYFSNLVNNGNQFCNTYVVSTTDLLCTFGLVVFYSISALLPLYLMLIFRH